MQTISDIKKMSNYSSNLNNLIKSQTGELSSDGGLSSNSELGEKHEVMTTEQLQTWLKQESISLNSTNNRTQEQQILLNAKAGGLNSEQLKKVSEWALNIHLSINERILAAYMLGLNQSEASVDSIFEVAKAEVPDLGPISPHSEAELRHTQETAIRFMQIDELFRRAKTDSKALDKLMLLTQDAQSEQVREYAQKKLKELKF